MKILTQDKEQLLDTIGANIFIAEGTCGCFNVMLEKGKKQYCLGMYENRNHAIRELRTLYISLKANYKLYEMRSARYYVGRY